MVGEIDEESDQVYTDEPPQSCRARRRCDRRSKPSALRRSSRETWLRETTSDV